MAARRGPKMTRKTARDDQGSSSSQSGKENEESGGEGVETEGEEEGKEQRQQHPQSHHQQEEEEMEQEDCEEEASTVSSPDDSKSPHHSSNGKKVHSGGGERQSPLGSSNNEAGSPHSEREYDTHEDHKGDQEEEESSVLPTQHSTSSLTSTPSTSTSSSFSSFPRPSRSNPSRKLAREPRGKAPTVPPSNRIGGKRRGQGRGQGRGRGRGGSAASFPSTSSSAAPSLASRPHSPPPSQPHAHSTQPHHSSLHPNVLFGDYSTESESTSMPTEPLKGSSASLSPRHRRLVAKATSPSSSYSNAHFPSTRRTSSSFPSGSAISSLGYSDTDSDDGAGARARARSVPPFDTVGWTPSSQGLAGSPTTTDEPSFSEEPEGEFNRLGARSFKLMHASLDTKARFRFAMAWVSASFFLSVALVAALLLIPLAEPSLGFAANWTYWAVFAPLNFVVVAQTFDTLASTLFNHHVRSWVRRRLSVVLYVVLATGWMILIGSSVAFPSAWFIICPVLCVCQFVALFFTFDAENRSDPAFRSQFGYFFLVCVLMPASFILHIIFILGFRVVTSQVSQAGLLVVLGVLNVVLRTVLINLGSMIHPRHEGILAFYQDFLSDFTLNMSLPALNNWKVFVLSVVINLTPHIFHLLRHFEWTINAQERALIVIRGERVINPLYPIHTYKSFEAAQVAARRERVFKVFFLVAVCEVYATLAYIVLLPVMAYGPQARHFPFIVALKACGNCLIYKALFYAAITVAAEILVVGAIMLFLIRKYFLRSWRYLVRESLMTGELDFLYLTFVQALVYCLAIAILGSHFGSEILVTRIFNGQLNLEVPCSCTD